MTPTRTPTPAAEEPATVHTPAQPDLAPPDPAAGGNYLRDPVTGVLSVNPIFETPQE